MKTAEMPRSYVIFVFFNLVVKYLKSETVDYLEESCELSVNESFE
jgi:hypothetical protein